MRALIYTLLTATLFVISPVQAQTAKPICQNVNDPDGDGWGWENNASCRMPANTSGVTNTVTSNTNSNDLTLSTLLGQCITELASQDSNNTTATTTASSSNCVDTAPVGDGWGWNGSTSCRVGASSQQNTNQQPTQCTTPTHNNSGSQGGQYGTGFTDYTNAQPSCDEASDRILRLVTVGMAESEVLRKVGKPRHVQGGSSNTLYWGYSSRYNSASISPYITFNTSGRTVRSFSVNSTNCR